jgi:hypothetical protein
VGLRRATKPPCYPLDSPREANVYGLPKDIDLTFLIGREVTQVAIGVYQVQFHFDEDVCISVESSFTYSDSQQEWTWREGLVLIAAHTAALLSAKIESFNAQQDGTISMVFSNGHRLTIFDSSKNYESYSITRPRVNIIV